MYKFNKRIEKRIVDNLKTRLEFVDFISSHDYVIVKCGAEWCGPCKRIKPTVLSLFDNMGEVNVYLIDIDVDKSPEIASALKVKILPTFINFIKGEQQDIYPTSNVERIKEFFRVTTMRLDN